MKSLLYKRTAEFADLDRLLNERLYRLEKLIIETKKEMMLRDKFDYDTSLVYVWRHTGGLSFFLW